MKKKCVSAVFAVIVILLFSTCEPEQIPQKTIDEIYWGKWETQSIKIWPPEKGAGTYTLPVTLYNTLINSYGYLIDATSIKVYTNGILQYTLTDTFFDKEGYSMTINGNHAVVYLHPDRTDNCIKVNTFSWE